MQTSVGRFARAGVWALAAYAVAYGLATVGDPHGPDRYRTVAALCAVWFALVGTFALVLLLSRRGPALVGMLATVVGATAQLSLAGPAGAAVRDLAVVELPAGRLALVGMLAHG